MQQAFATFSRRDAVKSLAILAASTAISESSALFSQQIAGPNQWQENSREKVLEISPIEDLMREHGALDRILLIYQEIITRLNTGKEFPLSSLSQGCSIIRRFIEDYHEKLEEDYLFPCFEKADKFIDLVKVLRQQHQLGWHLTDNILNLATQTSLNDTENKKKLLESLHLFIRMYRPHKATEDTVLFPAVRSIVSSQTFDELGDTFETKEYDLFGEDGFENVVGQIAKLEKSLGIHDLSQFTPKI
jgi:hemerythrin-like domain-containing protein